MLMLFSYKLLEGKEETIRNMFWDIFFIKIQDSFFQMYHPRSKKFRVL